MLLTETNINANIQVLNEDKNKPLKFRGIFAKVNHKTENGRTYSRELWEKCIESTSVQERLRRRQMLGELKHPEYRDIDIEKSAFIITKLWIDGDYVMGEAEIMPHPTLGGILEVFVRAGSQIGISSRGEGSIVEKSGESFVDPKDFELITFDTTLNPAVQEAQPQMVRESLYRGLESLRERCTVSQLKRVISVTENSINMNESKMKNSETDNSFAKGMKIGKIVEKLKEKMHHNLQLSRENAGLKIQLESSNLQVNSLKNLNEKLISKAEILMEKHDELKEEYSNIKSLKESKQDQTKILNSEFSSLKEKYNRSLELVASLMESIELYEERVLDSKSALEHMKSSIKNLEKKEEYSSRQLKYLKEKTEISGSEKNELLEEKEELLTEKEELQNEFETILSENKSLSKNLRMLKEQTKNIESKLQKITRENSALESKNQDLISLLKEARIEIKKNSRREKSDTNSSLKEGDERNIDEIKKGVHQTSQLNSRTTKVTNPEVSRINEESEDDGMTEILNKMMS